MAVAFLFLAPTAAGHEETALHALSVIDRVSPSVDGVSFRVAQLTQPVMIAKNTTDEPLVILGDRNEPFLRLHRGRIDTNVNSPLTDTSRDPSGSAIAPPDIDPKGATIWRRIETGSSWSWFDPRIRRVPEGPERWTLRALAGRREIKIEGSFEPLDGHGHFTTELIDPPQVEGLEIKLMDGLVPALFVKNDTGDWLIVTGRHGEPFLQIGPGGVLGNSRSPDYYLGGTQTVRDVPSEADPSAPPRWRKLSDVPVWSWLEFRARLPVTAHERSRLGTEQHTVLTWTTPLQLGGSSLPLRGAVEWIPVRVQAAQATDVEERSSLLPWLGAGIAVAVGAYFWARRMKATRP